MRLPGALLRLVPSAANGVGRSATCNGHWADCLAATGQHSLLLQPQPCAGMAPRPQPLPAVSLQCFQPQRQFFSLPGSSPDLSKHYKERRLIG